MATVATTTGPPATYRGSTAWARDTNSVPKDVFHVLGVFPWHIERRDPVDVLAGDSQGLAAGGEQRDARAGAQQCLCHAGRRLDHMLTIVDDQQELLGADRTRDTFV